jgi:hypothetical protein
VLISKRKSQSGKVHDADNKLKGLDD